MAMEQALNGIVDTISTILLVFEESNRNLNTKMKMNPTGALSKAIQVLIDLGEKVSATFELEEPKRKMAEVITDMKTTSTTLLNYSEKILNREDNEVIIKLIRNLMNSAVKMLKIQDEMKVKTIILAGKRATESVRRVGNVETIAQLGDAAGDMTTDLVNLAQLFNKRIELISNPTIVQDLKLATENIKTKTPEVINFTKEYLGTPEDHTLDRKKFDAFSALIEAISLGVSAVARSAALLSQFDLDFFFPGGGGYRPIDPALAERIAKMRAAIAKQLEELQNSKNKDRAAVTTEARDLVGYIREQIDLGRKLAEKVDDPVKRNALLLACNALESLAPQYLQAVKYAMDNPNDPTAQSQVANLKNQINEASAQIELAALNSIMDTHVKNMFQALNASDYDGAMEHAKNLEKNIEDQIKLGEAMAATSNPVQKKKILEAVSELKKFKPQLVSAVAQVIANPESQQAKEQLSKVVKGLQEGSAHLSEASIRPLNNPNITTLGDLPLSATDQEKTIINSGLSGLDNLDNLLLEVKVNDEPRANNALDATVSDFKKQIQLARSLANKCDDPKLKKALLDACDALAKLLPELIETTKLAMGDPNNPELQKKLADVISRVRNAAADVSLYTKEMSEWRDEKSKEEAKQTFDKRIPLDVAEALQSIVTNASHSQLPNSSPQGRLVATSRQIANLLAAFSVAAQSNDKKGMIDAARQIADSIKDVNEMANQIASNCANARLRETLLHIAQSPQNCGTQLKIIAAVKASHPDSKSTELQLWDCAKRLANSVAATISASESAALASK